MRIPGIMRIHLVCEGGAGVASRGDRGGGWVGMCCCDFCAGGDFRSRIEEEIAGFWERCARAMAGDVWRGGLLCVGVEK